MPETFIKKALDSIILAVQEDFKAFPDEESLLYYMFKDNLDESGVNFYEVAKSLLLRTDMENQRIVETRLMFDSERVMLPTIHVTMPSESAKDNAIGVTPFVSKDLQTYSRRFGSSFTIMATSNNRIEVLTLYYFLRHMLITIFDTLSLMGLENVTMGGQDMRLASSQHPSGVFSRGISLTADYDAESKIPNTLKARITGILFTGTIKDEI